MTDKLPPGIDHVIMDHMITTRDHLKLINSYKIREERQDVLNLEELTITQEFHCSNRYDYRVDHMIIAAPPHSLINILFFFNDMFSNIQP